jgi:hypothetical protein
MNEFLESLTTSGVAVISILSSLKGFRKLRAFTLKASQDADTVIAQGHDVSQLKWDLDNAETSRRNHHKETIRLRDETSTLRATLSDSTRLHEVTRAKLIAAEQVILQLGDDARARKSKTKSK